jgi:hypothetical protein
VRTKLFVHVALDGVAAEKRTKTKKKIAKHGSAQP